MEVLNFLQSCLEKHERRMRLVRYRSVAAVAPTDWLGEFEEVTPDDNAATRNIKASGPYNHIGALWFRQTLREKNHLWHADDNDLCFLKNILNPNPDDIFKMQVDGFTGAGASGAVIMFGTLHVGASVRTSVPQYSRYHDKVVFKFTFEQPVIEGGMDKNRTELETYKFLSTQSIPFVMQYYDSGICDTADIISSIKDEESRIKFCSSIFNTIAKIVTPPGHSPPPPPSITGQEYDDPQEALKLIHSYMSTLDTSTGFATFNGNPYRMLFIMTEKAQGRTLKEFIHDSKCTDRELMCIIAQIMWTLYRFQKIGVMHYDLHTDNVQVDDLKTVGSWRLFFGDGTQDFVPSRTQYMAKLVDWDLSAVISRPDSSAKFAECNTETTIKNSFLDSNTCDAYNICNKFVVGRDAVQILWWIQGWLHMRLQTFQEPPSNFVMVIKLLMAFIPPRMPFQGEGLAYLGHPCLSQTPPAPCVPIDNLKPPIDILKACKEALGTTTHSDDIICASVACNDSAVDDEREYEEIVMSSNDKRILSQLNELIEKS
jgi:hypothetical protein